MALVMSPGNFHASAAYLPSSFAMYMSFLGAAAFMNWRGGLKTSWGIWWFAVGGVLGWPFASALCAPFMLEEAIFASMSDRDHFWETMLRVGRGVLAGLLLLVSMLARVGLARLLHDIARRCDNQLILLPQVRDCVLEHCQIQHILVHRRPRSLWH